MEGIIGMLYVAEVKGVRKSTGEHIKWKVAVVGGERDDVDRKLKEHFDMSEYAGFVISNVLKVRDKVHVLNTVVTEVDPLIGAVIEDHDGTRSIYQGTSPVSDYNPKLFAVGVVTKVLAGDEKHALRKLGNYLIKSNSASSGQANSMLSEGSTVSVEEISRSQGYAMPRDVSSCINRASMVRG